MSRRLLIAAVFLLGGAVVNVAVAWGCYLRADPYQTITLILDRDIALWKKHAGHGWPPQPNQVTYGRAFGFETRSCSASGPDQVPDFDTPMGIGTGSFDWHLIWQDRAGWPAFSLLFGSGTASLSIPTRPIWPGFAVNTLFYAALLWLLTSGPFVLRRFIRVKRGLCPACAYPMGPSDVCSECGKPLPERMTVTT